MRQGGQVDPVRPGKLLRLAGGSEGPGVCRGLDGALLDGGWVGGIRNPGQQSPHGQLCLLRSHRVQVAAGRGADLEDGLRGLQLAHHLPGDHRGPGWNQPAGHGRGVVVDILTGNTQLDHMGARFRIAGERSS